MMLVIPGLFIGNTGNTLSQPWLHTKPWLETAPWQAWKVSVWIICGWWLLMVIDGCRWLWLVDWCENGRWWFLIGINGCWSCWYILDVYWWLWICIDGLGVDVSLPTGYEYFEWCYWHPYDAVDVEGWCLVTDAYCCVTVDRLVVVSVMDDTVVRENPCHNVRSTSINPSFTSSIAGGSPSNIVEHQEWDVRGTNLLWILLAIPDCNHHELRIVVPNVWISGIHWWMPRHFCCPCRFGMWYIF